jgi:formiminoglutamase
MSFMYAIADYLEPINKYEISNDEGYRETQLGCHIALNEGEIPDIETADMVIVGCSDNRGVGLKSSYSSAPDLIRKHFYGLYHWHKDVIVADVGNVVSGATIVDTYAALKSVVTELLSKNKKVIILGGGHDLSIGQYKAYTQLDKTIEMSCIDARIDLNMESVVPNDNFLMEILTSEPNFIKQYNHIGFQSYFVHPNMLETIDKLRFDCYRVGKVKENMDDMEPVIRNSNMVSFDIAAIQHAHAPANLLTPNGFTGEEACMLMQYSGMSHNVNSIGIYGYQPENDMHELTAKQISHMLWYIMDGIYKGKNEANIAEKELFNEFTIAFSDIKSTFLQSKKTGRWWMQLPDGKYIACTEFDYITAASNDIPERWMRAVERS